jgi:hypothetical protein
VFFTETKILANACGNSGEHVRDSCTLDLLGQEDFSEEVLSGLQIIIFSLSGLFSS